METKLFLSENVEAIHSFEMKRLPVDLSPIEAEMLSWQEPWRKESLEHYAKLGWSFICVKDSEILGYILGQPFLFFNNWTQSLWIESLCFVNQDVGFELMDVAIRWAKTKHLQKVLVNKKSKQIEFIQSTWPTFKENSYLHLSTTKLQEEA